MDTFLFSILTQSLTFLPLALGISISYNLLRATDMTLDASFVVGAGVFARLVTLPISPTIAAILALMCGALAGMIAATIQHGGRIDSLLAGILATFILSSMNLIIMGKPNINLISQMTLLSAAFEKNELLGWLITAAYVAAVCMVVILLLCTRIGLLLRAFGDNPTLLHREGKHIELYRLAGFAMTNCLASAAGCLTAQTVGYADIGMGFGMTLTGIGAIMLGQQILKRITQQVFFRIGTEFIACLIGVFIYFFAMNSLLHLNIDPIYLKLCLGLALVVFLRTAISPSMRS